MRWVRRNICDKVQKGDKTTVLLRVTGKGGNDAVVGHRNLESSDDFLLGQLAFIDELYQQIIVTLGSSTSQYAQGILVYILVLSGNVSGLFHSTVASHQVGLAVKHINNTLKILSRTHRNGNRTNLYTELLADVLDGAIVVGTLVLTVVQEGNAGLVPAVQVTPQFDGFNLGTGTGVHHHQGKLAGTECRNHFSCKVRGTGSIPHIYKGILPSHVCQGGID